VKRAVFSLIVLMAFAAPAHAQNGNAASSRSLNFGNVLAPAAASNARGFTVMANVGVGFEHDFFDGGAAGLAGAPVNFGIGGFITPKMAILGRFSGTVVEFSDAGISQTSGVIGATLQYWLNSRLAVEAGGGLGSWSDETGASDASGGLILGVSYIVWEHGAHHLVAGAEYAPVFTDGKVHNVGITLGYQFFRRR
jgi:hypothetical protein